MKITVIIPIYNVEKYLEKCINSVLNQTYKDLEIILINDGSTDNCKMICEKYKNKDERIIFIDKENEGLSTSRNRGLEIATGEYIAFLDSDDWIDKDMYEMLINLAEKYNVDIVECGYRNVYDDFNLENNLDIDKEDFIIVSNEEALRRLVFTEGVSTVVWNKIYKRDTLQGIKFEENKIYEDLFFTHKAIYKSKKLISVKSKKYNYRRNREGSITADKFSNKNMDYIDGINSRIEFFKSIGNKICLEETYKFKLAKLLEYVYIIYDQKIDKKILNRVTRELSSLAGNINFKTIGYGLNIKYLIYKIDENLYYNVLKKIRKSKE